MAQQKQVIMRAQERFDLPDYNALQNFVLNDFQLTNINQITNSNYILKGFEFEQVGSPSLAMNINVASSALIYGGNDGTFFVVEDTVSPISITLGAGSTTYVWLTVSTQETGLAVRTFWDPAPNNGQGAEFNQEVNTVRQLYVTAHTSTVGFPPADATVIPLCIAVTSSSDITGLTDHRNLLFRLGIGDNGSGSSNASYVYPWTNGRSEPNPNLISDANALIGGDKQLLNLKDWMNAVMSAIREMKFGTSSNAYWFNNTPTDLLSISTTTWERYIAMTGGGVFSWNSGTNTLSWTAAITFLIPSTAFTNTISGPSSLVMTSNQVAYVNIDRESSATLTPTVVNSSSFVPATGRIIIARNIGGTAYIGTE